MIRQRRRVWACSRCRTVGLLSLTASLLLITWLAHISAGGAKVEQDSASDIRRTAQPALQLQPRPEKKFLLLFSGHQGSSAVMDMLGALPEVFVPGFEPLDGPGWDSPSQKLAFLEAVFTFPASEAQFQRWRAQLAPNSLVRVNHSALTGLGQLARKTVAGFKMRPYLPPPGSSSEVHTAMTGLDILQVRALLHQHNVSLLLAQRRNPVKEALSWYKARDLGLRQFQAAKMKRQPGRPGMALVEQGSSAQGASALPTGSDWVGPVGVLLQGAAGGAATVLVNATRLLEWLGYVEYVNGQLLNATAFLQRPTFTIFYEDFLAAPVATVAQAASFIGANPAQLQPSTKFTKQAPDELQAAVLNFAELCQALQGTKYFQHLGLDSCPPCLAGDPLCPDSKGSTAWSEGSSGHAAGGGTIEPLPLLAHPHVQLVRNWCTLADKRAAGWDGLSDEECMRRAEESRAAAVARVREGRGTLLFKHVHKAGGSTLCKLAQRNMAAESARIPNRDDWDTNCVPFEAFLGPHPAVGIAQGRQASTGQDSVQAAAAQPAGRHQFAQRAQQQSQQVIGLTSGIRAWDTAGGAVPKQSAGVAPVAGAAPQLRQLVPRSMAAGETPSLAGGSAGSGSGPELGASLTEASKGRHGRRLQAHWLGGACWFGFLTPAQLRVLPAHFRPLTFLASEGPLPDVLPLDLPFPMITMLRRPLDRVLSSYRWWQLMEQRMPTSPAECRAYAAPANATLGEWLEAYPDNWMTRELVGLSTLYPDAATGELPELDGTHLLVAKQRLHRFAAVLVMEQWEESMRVMQDLFGWREVDFRLHRAGSRWNSAAEQELPPAVLQRLTALNEYDLELYEYALALAVHQEAASLQAGEQGAGKQAYTN